jgi:hypothetical protein
LNKLRDQLSPESIEEAIEHGKTLKLEEIVAELKVRLKVQKGKLEEKLTPYTCKTSS